MLSFCATLDFVLGRLNFFDARMQNAKCKEKSPSKGPEKCQKYILAFFLKTNPVQFCRSCFWPAEREKSHFYLQLLCACRFLVWFKAVNCHFGAAASDLALLDCCGPLQSIAAQVKRSGSVDQRLPSVAQTCRPNMKGNGCYLRTSCSQKDLCISFRGLGQDKLALFVKAIG